MTEMKTNESWERLDQGLKRAASCCREIGKMTNVDDWKMLGKQFVLLHKKATDMYHGKQLDEIQVQLLVNDIEAAQKAASYAHYGV